MDHTHEVAGSSPASPTRQATQRFSLLQGVFSLRCTAAMAAFWTAPLRQTLFLMGTRSTKSRLPTSVDSLPLYRINGMGRENRLRLADSSLHRLATVCCGQAGIGRHVDVLVHELHRTVAQQEQRARRVVASEVRHAGKSDQGSRPVRAERAGGAGSVAT